MSQVSLSALKSHLSLASDFAGDDDRLQGLIDTAESRIQAYLRRDLNTEFPSGWPDDLKHVIKVYAAFLDQYREPDLGYAAKHGLPSMIADLLADQRNMAG